MSENLHNPGNNGHGDQGHGDYEREDFTTGAVVGSLIGLIVMCVVSFFIVLGMYRYLEKSQMEHVPANPMVTLKESTRAPAKELGTEAGEVQAFPKPRLQDDDVTDMRQQLYGEESTLQSYGWVDQEAGEARIPIERAMELTAERGLPVRGEAAAKPVAVPVAASPAPVRKAAKGKAR
jgi:hypothetical protein